MLNPGAISLSKGSLELSPFVPLLDNITKASMRQSNGHVRDPEVVGRLWGLAISRCPDEIPSLVQEHDWFVQIQSFFSSARLLLLKRVRPLVGIACWLCGVRQGPITSEHSVIIPIPSSESFIQYFTDTGNKTGPFGCKANDQGRPHITSTYLNSYHRIIAHGQPDQPSNPMHTPADASLQFKSNNYLWDQFTRLIHLPIFAWACIPDVPATRILP